MTGISMGRSNNSQSFRRAASAAERERPWVEMGGRGVTALCNDPTLSTNVAPHSNTPHQYRLAQLLGAEINNDLVGIGAPPLEAPWYNRGANVTYARSDYAFGEINNNIISNEFDATLVEVALHDDALFRQLVGTAKAAIEKA